MPAVEVARRVFLYGPEFAESIDESAKYTLREVTGVDYVPPDDVETEPDAWGWDYFPPTRGFINWSLPEPNDIELLFEEPTPLSSRAKVLFKTEFGRCIKSGVSWDPDFDILDAINCMGSTKTYSDKDKKSVSNIEARRLKKKFSLAEQFKLKYVFVQKNQSEGRAAVVSEEKTLPMIKLFHRMFKAVADCPEDEYDNPDVLKGIERYLTSNNWREVFIMLDLKKSGLTFNRNIFNLLIEVLHENYPTWGWMRFYNYANCEVFHKGVYKPCTNGFGLGLMDCVVSFVQAVVYRIWVSEMNPFPSGINAEAKFWNDDSVVKITIDRDFPNFDVMEVVSNHFQEYGAFMTSLGMNVHLKKPYMSYKGVFLESYGEDRHGMSESGCNLIAPRFHRC